MSGKSGLATAGMVLGIVGIIFSAVPIINNAAFVAGLLALIFGTVVLIKTRAVKEARRGKAIAAVILGAVTLVIVLATQYMYSQALNKISDAAKEASTSASNASGDRTAELLKNDVTVTLGQFTAVTDQYVTNTELPVTVVNRASDKKSYTIHIEAVDASGNRITDDTVYANDLAAGQKQDFKAFAFVASDKVDALKTAKFNIVTVSQF